MTDQEITLINLIRNAEDPGEALNLAVEITLSVLSSPQEAGVLSPVDTVRQT